MKAEKPFNEVEMKVYSSLFLDYCILGGMPAVVREYISKGTLIKCGYGLYYYKKDDSYLEEDFFVRTKDYLFILSYMRWDMG